MQDVWGWTPLLVALSALAGGAAASPLDLADPTPRRIEVRLEVSPPSEPGRLDARWSPPLAAYLEPGSDPTGQVRIRIPADEIEGHLRRHGTETVPGTFSAFVWTLERNTGHVLQAGMQGRVRETLQLGPLRTTAEIAIRVDMSTQRRGGFRTRTQRFGQETHGYCAGSDADEEELGECHLVPVTPLDPQSGYVNAIGSVEAQIPLTRYRVFSPLGEARFSERRGRTSGVDDPLAPAHSGDAARASLGGPVSEDAVCSLRPGALCAAGHGGMPWTLDRTLEEPLDGAAAATRGGLTSVRDTTF